MNTISNQSALPARSPTVGLICAMAAFIAGLALGGLWVRRVGDRIADLVRYAGYVQVLMGLCAIASVWLLGQAYYWVPAILKALARTESDDLGSAPRGGDIGFVAKGSTVAAFEAAAYALPTGETSGIVATEYGFHILHVDAREPMSLDSMRAVIANELAHRELEAVIDHGFTLNTAYFGRP